MLTISTYQTRGGRPTQEDRYAVAAVGEGRLLAVFDGHGGPVVAEAAAERVADLFTQQLDARAGIAEALQATVATLVTDLADGCPETGRRLPGGTTATLAYVTATQVGMAVLGDSPALLQVGEDVYIAPEHCVDLCPEDVARIRAAQAERFESGELRVFAGNLVLDNLRSLMLTRAIGDPEFEGILIREPHVEVIERPAGAPMTLILASDGIRITDGSGDPEARLALYREYLALAAEGGAEAVGRRIGGQPEDNATVVVARAG